MSLLHSSSSGCHAPLLIFAVRSESLPLHPHCCQIQNRRHRLYSNSIPPSNFSPHPSAQERPRTCPQTRLFPPHPPTEQHSAAPRRSSWLLFARVCASLCGVAVGSFLILTPVWHTCLARQNPSPRIKRTPDSWDQHARNGRALDVWFVTSPPRELLPVPLYFVLLTCSYDLQSFKRVVPSEIPWLPAPSFLYLCCRHNLRPRSRCQSTLRRASERHQRYPSIGRRQCNVT